MYLVDGFGRVYVYNVVCKADKRIRVNASLCLGRGIGRGREEGGESVNIRSAEGREEEKRRRETRGMDETRWDGGVRNKNADKPAAMKNSSRFLAPLFIYKWVKWFSWLDDCCCC